MMQCRTVKFTKLPALGQGGFTLLEVLAAVLILGLAYVAVLENFSISLRNIDKVSKTRQAVFADLNTFSSDTKFTGDTSLETDAKEEGVLFMEGEKYKLMVVTSASGEMATLKLQPIL
jgi:prepilin-type N-terminal cleavage/methylation domain-containing protein